MKKIADFAHSYHKAYNEYEIKKEKEEALIYERRKRIVTAEKAIERAEKRIKETFYPYWFDVIIKNIAKEMMQYFPNDYIYKILGPFGLSSHISIYINHPKWNHNKPNDFPHFSFTFVPDINKQSKCTLSMIDYSVNTGEYPEGSIGHANGFNHPLIPIDNNTTIKELILLYYPDFKFKD